VQLRKGKKVKRKILGFGREEGSAAGMYYPSLRSVSTLTKRMINSTVGTWASSTLSILFSELLRL
jgi:hypothetical protein